MKLFLCVLHMECRKAFENRFFFIAVLVGCVFSFFSCLYNVQGYIEIKRNLERMGGNPMTQAFGLYNLWIGGESNSLGFALFFMLFPLLAVFPYGWSYQAEKKNGYLKMAEIRAGRRNYLLAKYIAAFLTGGCSITLPLLANFVGTACFVPAVKPTIIYDIYYPMHYGGIGSQIFFENPLCFVLMYMVLDFIYGGLFAVLGIAIGFFSKNRVVPVIGPFLFALALQYLRTFLFGRIYKEISPLYFLHAASVENVADARIICVEGLLILGLTLGIVWGRGRRSEDI